MSMMERAGHTANQPRPVSLDDLTTDPRIEAARVDAERLTIETRAEIERRRLLRAEEAEQRRLDEETRATLRAERRDRQRAERAERQRQRAAALQRAAERAVPVVALVGVNTLAITGQLGFALEHLSLPGFGVLDGWPLAILFAAVVESIALFLAYHAARALRRRDSAAGKHLAAYLVAAVVAGVNYSHWAGPGFAPNATAIVFGLVSLLSPWLWGIHAKAVHRDELSAAGEIDPRGPKLSTSRWLWHPVKSLRVIAYASWEGISDPAQAVAAWEAAGRPTAIRGTVKGDPKTTGTGGRSGAGTGEVTGTDGVTGTGGRSGAGTGEVTGTDGVTGTRARKRVPRSHTVTPLRSRSSRRKGNRTSGTAVAQMRRYWEAERAAGRTPSGADLNRAAGKDPDSTLGRRYRREWRKEEASA